MRLDTSDLMELARHELKSKNQPRVPAGSPHGGEFSSGSSVGGSVSGELSPSKQAAVDLNYQQAKKVAEDKTAKANKEGTYEAHTFAAFAHQRAAPFAKMAGNKTAMNNHHAMQDQHTSAASWILKNPGKKAKTSGGPGGTMGG